MPHVHVRYMYVCVRDTLIICSTTYCTHVNLVHVVFQVVPHAFIVCVWMGWWDGGDRTWSKVIEISIGTFMEYCFMFIDICVLDISIHFIVYWEIQNPNLFLLKIKIDLSYWVLHIWQKHEVTTMTKLYQSIQKWWFSEICNYPLSEFVAWPLNYATFVPFSFLISFMPMVYWYYMYMYVYLPSQASNGVSVPWPLMYTWSVNGG